MLQGALEEIFRTYQPALIRYLRTMAADLADDVASQTWLSVAQSIDGFTGDGNALRGWILTIGRRRLVDEFRRHARRPEVVAAVPEVVDSETPDDVIVAQVGWAQRLIGQLPPQQGEVVLLRVIGGLSVAETAEVTGHTPGNVRVLAHRGLAGLLELLAGDDEAAEDLALISRVTQADL